MAKDRKTQIAAAAANDSKKRGSVKDYFKGVRLEVKKVVWPTKEELIAYTGATLVACAAFGLGVWAVDTGFLACLRRVLDITM